MGRRDREPAALPAQAGGPGRTRTGAGEGVPKMTGLMRSKSRRIRIGALLVPALVALSAAAVTGSASGGPAAPATSTVAASTSTAIPGGPVPAGFQAADLSFTSAADGWALGTAPCATAPCTSVLHTTDGGAHWSGGHAPLLNLLGSSACTNDAACVSQLRFASQRVGYAYGWGLAMTTDSGASWSRVPSPNVFALAPAGNANVLRVVAATPGCPPGCSFAVQSAPVGSTNWQTLPAPPVRGDYAQIVRSGANQAYVLVFANPAGGAQGAHTTVLHTANGGRSWNRFADPCGAPGGQEADAVDAAALGNSLTVLCRPRMSPNASFLITSANQGASFGPARPLPPAGIAASLALSPSGLLAVPMLQVVAGKATWTVQTSGNGGASWAPALRTAATSTVVGGAGQPGISGFIGFQTPATGRFAAGPTALFTTTTGAAGWTPQRY